MAMEKVDGIGVEIKLDTTKYYKDLDKVEDATRKATENIKKDADTISKSVSEGVKESGKGIAETTKNIAQYGQSLSVAGSNLTNSITKPLMNVAKSGVESAISFENSMGKVHTIMDTSVMSLDEMGLAIQNLSINTGISAEEIADNVYNAISAGQSTGDAISFVTESTKLAKAGFAEAGQSLDVLTTILNAYGLEADQVGMVSDTLIQIQNKGKTTVAELSATMGKIIPTANSMGVSLDQLGAGYALMTSKGIATAETTTYMNSLLNELGKSGTTAADALKKQTGKSFQELTEAGMPLGDVLVELDDYAKKNKKSLSDMFGSAEAGKAALVLATDSGDAFNTLLEDMGNSLGATDEAFNKVSDTTANKMQIAMNDLKVETMKLMQDFLPAISNLIEKFSDMMEWFRNLSPEAKKLGMMIAGVAMAIGPLLSTIGTMITVFAPLISAITTAGGVTASLSVVMGVLTGPIGIVIGAVGALALAFATDFGGIRTTTFEICGQISELFTMWWEAVKSNWGESLDAIKALVEVVWESIKTVIDTVLQTISGIIKAVTQAINGDWSGAWETMKQTASNLMNAIKDVVKNIFDAIVNVVIAVGVNLANAMYRAWTQAKEKAVEVWNNLCSWFKGAVEDPVGTIKGIGSALYNAGKGMITSVWDGCKSIWASVSSWFTDKVNWIKDKLTFWNSSKSKMSSGGSGSSAGYSPMSLNRLAYAIPTSSTQTTNITFSGNYNFSNRGDIDYFMQQAGQQMRRNR